MNAKALGYLSLARRGRLLEAGEEPVGAACRAGHARLLVVAEDASEHSVRRAQSFVAGTRQPWIKIPCTKEALGDAIGYSGCAMAAFTDVRLALAFVKALEEPERHAALLQELEGRAARVEQRRREEKAHQKNLHSGGKRK